jgi:hypothetical protein
VPHTLRDSGACWPRRLVLTTATNPLAPVRPAVRVLPGHEIPINSTCPSARRTSTSSATERATSCSPASRGKISSSISGSDRLRALAAAHLRRHAPALLPQTQRRGTTDPAENRLQQLHRGGHHLPSSSARTSSSPPCVAEGEPTFPAPKGPPCLDDITASIKANPGAGSSGASPTRLARRGSSAPGSGRCGQAQSGTGPASTAHLLFRARSSGPSPASSAIRAGRAHGLHRGLGPVPLLIWWLVGRLGAPAHGRAGRHAHRRGAAVQALGILATTDNPFVLYWTLCIIALYAAARHPTQWGPDDGKKRPGQGLVAPRCWRWPSAWA